MVYDKEDLEVKKDFLLLWGGVDINPALYGEEPHPRTQKPNQLRDTKEVAHYLSAVNAGIPIIGVCRGAQLLCALNGGKLYQHTNDHACSHAIYTKDNEVFEPVSAGHHQVMRPEGTNHVVYGWDGRSCICYDSHNDPHIVDNAPEIVWFPDTKSLAIQPHPEWMRRDDPFNIWLDALVFKLTGVKNAFT